MGLLHKNLILAGIASVAMVGVLGSSSVSALDGFSFSDIINQQQAQIEQLLSYSTNPFDTSTACESTNPDSTISCNEVPFPSLLFNRISDGEKLWGHDGKGIVFADSENLINGNLQLKTAKRGDTLTFSVKLEAEDYYDAAETDPITEYRLGSLISSGLDVDLTSVQLKVNGQVTPLDSENVQPDFEDTPADEVAMGADFAKLATLELQWFRDDRFLYPENSVIEVVYSATITDDAPSKVFSRVAYMGMSQSRQEILSFASPAEILSGSDTSSQATALLDGNILIRRVDANGNPLAGAKYTIDGVKANVEDEANNIYIYDKNGVVSEFTTNDKGRAIIKGVPMGEYTVKETKTPDGHLPQTSEITKSLANEIEEFEIGDYQYILNVFGSVMDVTKSIKVSSSGDKILGLDLRDEQELAYNAEQQYYGDDNLNISKSEDGYVISNNGLESQFSYDERLGKYALRLTLADYYNKAETIASTYYLEFTGDNVIAHLGGGGIMELPYDEDLGCWSQEQDDTQVVVCKDGDGYQLESYSDGRRTVVGATFKYDDRFDKFILNYDYVYFTINDIAEDSLTLATNPILNYSEAFDRYYMGGAMGIFQLPIDYSAVKSTATEYLFTDSNVSPDNIPNPQTSDTLTKATCIILITTASAFVITRKLSRR